MKNPLFTDAVLAGRCPHPQAACWATSTEDGMSVFSPVRCNRPSCRACGPRNMRILVSRVTEKYAADKEAGRRSSFYFLTINIRPSTGTRRMDHLTLLQGLGQAVTQAQAAQTRKGWGGTKVGFIRILHFKPDGTAHAHLLVSHLEDTVTKRPIREMFRHRIEHYMDLRVRREMHLPRRQRGSIEPPIVHIYFQQCRSITGSLAYMLWDRGRPWRGDWPLPKGMTRVRSTPGFLGSSNSHVESQTPQTRRIPVALSDVAALIARANIPLEFESATRLTLKATPADLDRLLSPAASAELPTRKMSGGVDFAMLPTLDLEAPPPSEFEGRDFWNMGDSGDDFSRLALTPDALRSVR